MNRHHAKGKMERTILSKREEGDLAEWIKKSARLGFGKTKSQVLTSVQSVIKGQNRTTSFKEGRPGDKWYKLFMQRHSELSIRKPQTLGSQRAGVTQDKIMGWFHYAHRDITSIDPDVLNHPTRIFICDESGFQLGGGIEKVLASKDDKRVYQITSDTHQQITVLACGSASGQVLPPLIIFPGQRFSYNPTEGFDEADFARSPNGWIDSSIFTKWMSKSFIQKTAHIEKPITPFVDGHSTHMTLDVCQLCRDNGIILYQLPSHLSHIVQTLDLTTFKNLKQAWREQVLDYQVNTGSFLSKREFARVFKKAWTDGIQPEVVRSGFSAAGIYPWSPSNVDISKTGPSQLFVDEETPSPTPPDENEIFVTEENAIFPLSPIMDPPSPSPYPSALPPLSPSPPLDHVLSPHLVPTPTTPHSVPSLQSVQSADDHPSHREDFFKFIYLVAQCDVETVNRRIAMADTGFKTIVLVENQFINLYGHLMSSFSKSGGQQQPFFSSLPLPCRFKTTKRSAVQLQPSNMLTSEAFIIYRFE